MNSRLECLIRGDESCRLMPPKKEPPVKINPLWGFDPVDLLRRTNFPNDENEYKIRHSKAARLVNAC
jgi:hypothetical protein